MPFGEAAEAFLKERPGHISERSIQFEKERLKPLKEFFGDKSIGKIRGDDIRGYQRVRREAGLSSKTINMDVGVLRLLLKRAKTWTIVYRSRRCEAVSEAAARHREGPDARPEGTPLPRSR